MAAERQNVARTSTKTCHKYHKSNINPYLSREQHVLEILFQCRLRLAFKSLFGPRIFARNHLRPVIQKQVLIAPEEIEYQEVKRFARKTQNTLNIFVFFVVPFC